MTNTDALNTLTLGTLFSTQITNQQNLAHTGNSNQGTKAFSESRPKFLNMQKSQTNTKLKDSTHHHMKNQSDQFMSANSKRLHWLTCLTYQISLFQVQAQADQEQIQPMDVVEAQPPPEQAQRQQPARPPIPALLDLNLPQPKPKQKRKPKRKPKGQRSNQVLHEVVNNVMHAQAGIAQPYQANHVGYNAFQPIFYQQPQPAPLIIQLQQAPPVSQPFLIPHGYQLVPIQQNAYQPPRR